MGSESRGKVFLMRNESHGKVLLKNLRDNELLWDYTLTAEGEELHVHKAVLAACSDYFKAMFSANMQESKNNKVELKGVSASTLKSLVNFCYTGDLELSFDNVEKIVSTSQYFQISDAVDVCSEFLKENITHENWTSILDLIETYSLSWKVTEQLLLQWFEHVPEKMLLKLDRQHLVDLIGSDSLHISSEYRLFEKVISCQSVLPNNYVVELLHKVRFPLLSSSDLSKVAQSQVMSSQRCQDLLSEALNYQADPLMQPSLQNERTKIRVDKNSFVFTGNNRFFNTSDESMVQGIQHFMHSDYLADFFPLEQMVVVDNFMYVCSLHGTAIPQRVTWFRRFDPRFWDWQNLEPLSRPRHDFPLIPVNRKIYAIGGSETQSVEVFSIDENKWENCAPINYFNSNSAGAELEGKVYVSGGGKILLGEACSDVSCYDPLSDSWESKSPMIKDRIGHYMAAVGRKLYAFGGRTGDYKLTVECYDPVVDQWTLSSVRLHGEVEGLAVNSGVCLFRPASSEKVLFEKYDPETDSVTETVEKKIPIATFGHWQERPFLCACLTIPPV